MSVMIGGMKNLIKFLAFLVIIVVVVVPQGCELAASSHFTLWQLPSQTRSQNMSYVLRSDAGHIIVIDGGNTGDAEYLRGFLAALGNHVHAWFVSHPHPDHVDALTAILTDSRELKIDCIYGSIPDEEWVQASEPAYLGTIKAFNGALLKAKKEVLELVLGQSILIDGVHIEILGIKNPEIHANPLNDSSLVMRVSDSSKSVLFLGDLGEEGGKKLLQGPYRARLKSQYVQMAHHGQHGVSEDFYQVVQPSYCLWPTPLWLWDNDSGKGKGSGPWQTLTVRAWMKQLGVRENYVSYKGCIRID